MGEVRQALQYFRLNKARDRGEWLAAMRLQALPSVNFVFADRDGNIGYVYNALFPNRPEGVDWKHVLPGDRSDLIWKGYLPFERVPQLWNPKAGFLVNSNNTPFRATADGDNLDAAGFPASMGIQANMTNRALRALEMFGSDRRIGAEAFRRYKFDLHYSSDSDLARYIREIAAADPSGDPDFKHAQELLESWDRSTGRNSRAAALAVLMGLRVTQTKDGPQPVSPVDALKEAIAVLKSHFGRIDPEWGAINRFRRGKLDLPIDGGPDVFRAVQGEPQDDGTITAATGDTLVMFVTWDAAGNVSSESIHQFGSATLDERSPHYADQTPLFVAMMTKPVHFTEEELAGHVKADYRPGDPH
jgi:penicillin amidase/acyl-homoserine-lactone acylase